MSLPCSCETPKVEGEIKENRIYACKRCNRVILNIDKLK
jgi:hypothetical protein